MTKASHRLATGDRVALAADPHRPPVEVTADDDVEFTVVHDDDDVIVIDKPAGLVVHPGRATPGTLVHGLLARFPEMAPEGGEAVGEPDRPGIVHRLDKGTSGLLVVARTPEAYESLVALLAAHAVERALPAAGVGPPRAPAAA